MSSFQQKGYVRRSATVDTFFSVLKASMTIDELYHTDSEEYDNYGIPESDYDALVEESLNMEENETKVNLII